jgi:hypothetical protein
MFKNTTEIFTSSEQQWRTENHIGKTQCGKTLYEKSCDINNPEFRAILEDLHAHNGKLTKEGWFY